MPHDRELRPGAGFTTRAIRACASMPRVDQERAAVPAAAAVAADGPG
jgi:hypothetical protein